MFFLQCGDTRFSREEILEEPGKYLKCLHV